MKLHQKGYLLVQLGQLGVCWDDALIRFALAEYGLAGRFAENSLRIALDELFSAGLIRRLAHRLDPDPARAGQLQFQYHVSEFGRQRMRDTGLLAVTPQQRSGSGA